MELIGEDLFVNTDNSSDLKTQVWGVWVHTDSSGNGIVYLDILRDFGATQFKIRTRVAGTPIDALIFTGAGNAAFSILAGTAARPVQADSTGSITATGRTARVRGADVASANDLVLGADGVSFGITGTTNINGIKTLGWQSGSEVKLFLLGAITVKHNTAPSTGFAKFNLQGAADFVAASGAVLTVEYDGSVWQETARRTA